MKLCCSSVVAPVVSLEHPLVLGDEVPSPGFSKLWDSWGLSGAGLSAVPRWRQRLREREETRRKCWSGGLGWGGMFVCSQELLRFVPWFCTTEQLFFVVVIMKIQPNPCSFPKVKVAFSLPEDRFEIEGWPLAYFCTNITGCIPAAGSTEWQWRCSVPPTPCLLATAQLNPWR